MSHVMPGNVNRVKLYKDDVPLFSRFQIEHQIETAYSRAVAAALRRRDRHRPHRGAGLDRRQLARAPRAARDIEETAFRTNLEAADEIARQLRLRDLGGLIVIDFIDMESAAQPARGREPPARRAAATTAPACRSARSRASA